MNVDVTTASFQSDVIDRSFERPVVVDFWADWCGPCRMLTPVLEAAVAERDAQVDLVKMDVDAEPDLAARYGVQGIPAVKAFRNGQVVSEFVGARPRPAVDEFLDALLQPPEAERLVAELRAGGEYPDVLGAIDAGDYERAFDLLLARLEDADPDERDELRRLMVALFEQLGQDDPLSARYRRRLAAALY